jgi:hypothetical protein
MVLAQFQQDMADLTAQLDALLALDALRMRVAAVTRQSAAYQSLLLPSFTRLFNQLEWDEGLHPRGANGKFIGGSGLQAEREAHHLSAALKAFDAAAKTAPIEEVADRKARMTWRGVKGYAAIKVHLANLQAHAKLKGSTLAHRPADLVALNDLHQYYQRRLTQKPGHVEQGQSTVAKASLKDNPNAKSRLMREMAIIERHMAHAGATPQRSYGIHPDLVRQIEEGIAQDAARPRPIAASKTSATGRPSGGKAKPFVGESLVSPADNLVTSDQLKAQQAESKQQQQQSDTPSEDDWLHQVLRLASPAVTRDGGAREGHPLRDAQGHFAGWVGGGGEKPTPFTGLRAERQLVAHRQGRAAYTAEHGKAAYQERSARLTRSAKNGAAKLTPEHRAAITHERDSLIQRIAAGKGSKSEQARMKSEAVLLTRHLGRNQPRLSTKAGSAPKMKGSKSAASGRHTAAAKGHGAASAHEAAPHEKGNLAEFLKTLVEPILNGAGTSASAGHTGTSASAGAGTHRVRVAEYQRAAADLAVRAESVMMLAAMERRFTSLMSPDEERREGHPLRDAHGRFIGWVGGGGKVTLDKFSNKGERQAPETAKDASLHAQHVHQALRDWSTGRAYVDAKGNYHLKGKTGTSGPIAPWNKAAKREFASVDKLHEAAQKKSYTVQGEPQSKSTKSTTSKGTKATSTKVEAPTTSQVAVGPAPKDLTDVPTFNEKERAQIAASWERLPDLNPDGASHEFYKASAGGQDYFFKPSSQNGVAQAHLMYAEADRLGLSQYVTPTKQYTDAQGRVYHVLPWVTGPRLDDLAPAEARAVVARIDPETQAKLGFYHYVMGMADVGANNVMMIGDTPVSVDLDSLVLSGFSATPVMIDAFFGNSYSRNPGADGRHPAFVGGKIESAIAKVARMPVPAATMDWMRTHILAHEDALLRQIDAVARTGMDLTERNQAAYYTQIMADALIRMAYLRQFAATPHPTWGKLSKMTFGMDAFGENAKGQVNPLVHYTSWMEKYAYWDTPAHTIQEVIDLLARNGVTLHAKGVTLKMPED